MITNSNKRFGKRAKQFVIIRRPQILGNVDQFAMNVCMCRVGKDNRNLLWNIYELEQRSSVCS